jgi:hypothetical protein
MDELGSVDLREIFADGRYARTGGSEKTDRSDKEVRRSSDEEHVEHASRWIAMIGAGVLLISGP